MGVLIEAHGLVKTFGSIRAVDGISLKGTSKYSRDELRVGGWALRG